MELTPEIKAQLAEQKKQCVFCKLISGEMEAKKVFEDDVTVAMLDIYPAIKGHTIFMLKEHYPIMPYIPADEFKHCFGLIPQIANAVREGMVTTSSNVFIANGGVAGQQSPHFLIHLFPREEGDGFFNFLFKNHETLEEDKVKMLQNNFPIMMNNHFGRNPADWHSGPGETPAFLVNIRNESKVLYEDEKVLCVLPDMGVVPGHMQIYSKEEETEIGNLSIGSSSHLFFAASFAATAVFEGLGAQGTNIILKSGKSDDNPEGKLCLHILPRNPDDSLKSLMWEPKQPSYDLDSVKSQIKDKAFTISYGEKKAKKVKTVKAPEVIKIGGKKKETGGGTCGSGCGDNCKEKKSGNEIEDAIRSLQK